MLLVWFPVGTLTWGLGCISSWFHHASRVHNHSITSKANIWGTNKEAREFLLIAISSNTHMYQLQSILFANWSVHIVKEASYIHRNSQTLKVRVQLGSLWVSGEDPSALLGSLVLDINKDRASTCHCGHSLTLFCAKAGPAQVQRWNINACGPLKFPGQAWFSSCSMKTYHFCCLVRYIFPLLLSFQRYLFNANLSLVD